MAFVITKAVTKSIFFPCYSYSSSPSPKLHSSSSSVRFNVSLKFTPAPRKQGGFQLHSSVTLEDQIQVEDKSQIADNRRKLFVLNLPWSYSVTDIKKLFGECGAVEDVVIIKHKDGNNRGFAFLTMASGEGAQAAIHKYHTHEHVGRILRVELSKRFKKPTRTVAPLVAGEIPLPDARYKLYVSNLAWKARSNHLRDLFHSKFNPLSVRVVFDSHSGRSAGYGFVSFATEEEAQSAISALHGKELLGRQISLKFSKFSEKNDDTEASQTKEEGSTQQEKEEESRQQQPRVFLNRLKVS